jgi:predicted esterase
MSRSMQTSRSIRPAALAALIAGGALSACQHATLDVGDGADARAGGGRDASVRPASDLASPADDLATSAADDLAPACDDACSPPPGTSLCFMDPPQGATLAPPPPVYKGTCPMLIPAVMGENTLMSSGNARLFLLAVPAKLDPKEKLPVVFLWHWLGGSAMGFYTKGEVQAAVDQQRFLAVIPDNKKVNGKSDLLWKWPFAVSDSQARIDEELQFFDDMYACVAAQFNTNKECLSSVGVSAGALFTDQLAAARGNVLASAESLSGGVGGFIRPWGNPQHALPMMVLWGGPMDQCGVANFVINFQDESHNLEDALTRDGNFLLECVHNCGHGVPPFVAPIGLSTFAPLWQFMFDHPYWLGKGDSPYLKSGVPNTFPSWCAIGKGNAVPRVGMCAPPGC